MSVQFLISTVNCENCKELLDKMNINGNAIIVNQYKEDDYEIIKHKGSIVHVYHRNERGVGKSRNLALANAETQYCLFVDDDMVMIDSCGEYIESAFAQRPDADIILFNLHREDGKIIIEKPYQVKWWNFMKFGAAGMAVRREKIVNNDISFNLNFGGGTIYGSGEDTIFFSDCIRKGLIIYAVDVNIAYLTNRKSTWFKGYDRKYLYDKGALYCAISRKWSKLLCLQALVRHPYIYKEQRLSLFEALKVMKQGIKGFEQGMAYKE